MRKVAGNEPSQLRHERRKGFQMRSRTDARRRSRTVVSVYALHVTDRIESSGLAHPYPLSPMFSFHFVATAYATALPPTSYQCAGGTPAAAEPAILRFQTVEDVDARFAIFLEHAEYVEPS